MGIFDSLAGAGISAATGNIFGAGLSLIGGIMGAVDTSNAAADSQRISTGINTLEGQANQQHYNAMQISASRQSLESIRQAQQARSLALSAGTNQNAQFGSGLQGGLNQITSQGLFNLQGINQNRQIGENLFGIDSQISTQKLALQGVQTDLAQNEAIDKSIGAVGGFVSSSSKSFGNLSQQFGSGF